MGTVVTPSIAALPAAVLPGAVLVLVGVGLWTLGEYALHRFDMHGLRGRGTTSRAHLEHHAGRVPVPERSTGDWAGAVVLGVAVGWWAHPLVGAGWVAGYGFYDLQHWAIHARPPRGRYGRWLRRNHLHHHFADPRADFGLTSPLWDHVFRTHTRPGVVAVPRRLAMPWLIDATGTIVPEHAADYTLGRPSPDPAADPAADGAAAAAAVADRDRDRADAFANRPPAPD